jgi:transcriptional regulator with XRE-family HTH domain
MQPAAAAHDGFAETGVSTPSKTEAGGRRAAPLPLRPRGGFGAYLNELRRERGLTIRQLAAAAGVHHTYVSKLERGDRQAPDETVTEALAAALGATPAQVDQLRWRAGHAPHGGGAPGQDDPTMTLVAEALGDGSLTPAQRDRLRQTIAQVVQEQDSGPRSPVGAVGAHPGVRPPAVPAHGLGGWAAGQTQRSAPTPDAPRGWSDPSVGAAGWTFAGASVPAPATPPVTPAYDVPPDGRSAVLAGLLGGWQTLDEAAAELRVTAAYLWELVQTGHLRAWALPGAPPNSPAGIRLHRDDVLALLQPVQPAQPMQPYQPRR